MHVLEQCEQQLGKMRTPRCFVEIPGTGQRLPAAQAVAHAVNPQDLPGPDFVGVCDLAHTLFDRIRLS
jgi:hypothetical protein